jgi:CheY-like chemotaxis protein
MIFNNKIPSSGPPDMEEGANSQDDFQPFKDKVRKLFIVDDDEIMVYLSDNLIRQQGFCDHSENFQSGRAALDSIRELLKNGGELPELMLVDINMPVMNGWDFMDELLTLPGGDKIPVFIFTSSIDPADKDRSFSYRSVRGHIQKPLTVVKLNKILRLLS